MGRGVTLRAVPRTDFLTQRAGISPWPPWILPLFYSSAPAPPPCFHCPTTPQVLGILDDIILLPLGIWLVRAAIPDHVLADARGRAAEMIARGERPPVNWVAGAIVVAIWVACAAWAALALRGWLQGDKGVADGIAATGSGT